MVELIVFLWDLNGLQNGTKDSIAKLVTELNNAKLEDDVDIIVAPPFVYIDQVKISLNRSYFLPIIPGLESVGFLLKISVLSN